MYKLGGRPAIDSTHLRLEPNIGHFLRRNSFSWRVKIGGARPRSAISANARFTSRLDWSRAVLIDSNRFGRMWRADETICNDQPYVCVQVSILLFHRVLTGPFCLLISCQIESIMIARIARRRVVGSILKRDVVSFVIGTNSCSESRVGHECKDIIP